jgi:hypothetical protein
METVKYEVFVYGRYYNIDAVYDDGSRTSDHLRDGDITVDDVRLIHSIEHPECKFGGVKYIFC